MNVTELTTQVLDDVLQERYRQFAKFGEENILTTRDDGVKLAVLGEEYGEVAKEICESEYGHDTDDNLYKELIQVAAVATAFAESMRRDKRIA